MVKKIGEQHDLGLKEEPIKPEVGITRFIPRKEKPTITIEQVEEQVDVQAKKGVERVKTAGGDVEEITEATLAGKDLISRVHGAVAGLTKKLAGGAGHLDISPKVEIRPDFSYKIEGLLETQEITRALEGIVFTSEHDPVKKIELLAGMIKLKREGRENGFSVKEIDETTTPFSPESDAAYQAWDKARAQEILQQYNESLGKTGSATTDALDNFRKSLREKGSLEKSWMTPEAASALGKIGEATYKTVTSILGVKTATDIVAAFAGRGDIYIIFLKKELIKPLKESVKL